MAPQEDGSHLLSYTKDRGSAENNSAPVFAENAITIEDDAAELAAGEPVKAFLIFQSATDDDQVHNYTIKVTENGQRWRPSTCWLTSISTPSRRKCAKSPASIWTGISISRGTPTPSR